MTPVTDRGVWRISGDGRACVDGPSRLLESEGVIHLKSEPESEGGVLVSVKILSNLALRRYRNALAQIEQSAIHSNSSHRPGWLEF